VSAKNAYQKFSMDANAAFSIKRPFQGHATSVLIVKIVLNDSRSSGQAIEMVGTYDLVLQKKRKLILKKKGY
jgi:ribosomal protein S16